MSYRSAFGTGITVLFSVATLVSPAQAEEPRNVAASATTEIFVLAETEDAWLHDHCAFRGTFAGAPNGPDPGAVFELVYELSGKPIAKQFRCVEQPPFWKGAWTPASATDLACTDTKGVCTPPLSSDVSPAVSDTARTSSAPPAHTAQSAELTNRPSTTVLRGAPPTKASSSTLGWVLVGTGITALAGAGVAGAVVLDAKATTNSSCSAAMTCDAKGLEAAERGRTASLVATVAFGVGAAALTSGIIVLVLGKPKEKHVGIGAHTSMQGATFSLEGRF